MSANPADPARRLSVAPMMDWTDRWCRRFHRLLTRRALLFTEMVVADAVIRGDRERLLGFDAVEHPLALQLGGSHAAALAQAARIGAGAGYDEINLNVGCPSDRVREGRFGACLMKEPETVARAVAAMRAAVGVPVTVKCRIGVDDQDPGEALLAFVDAVAAAGCSTFYVHARKAWLAGLSPKANRTAPPLDYALVRRLKAARPGLEIILNGGIETLDQARDESAGLDGAMLGRAAYERPYDLLAAADARVFAENRPTVSRDAVVEGLMEIACDVKAAGRPMHALARHALGLMHAAPGARVWRRTLSQAARQPGAGPEVFKDAYRAATRAVEAA